MRYKAAVTRCDHNYEKLKYSHNCEIKRLNYEKVTNVIHKVTILLIHLSCNYLFIFFTWASICLESIFRIGKVCMDLWKRAGH